MEVPAYLKSHITPEPRTLPKDLNELEVFGLKIEKKLRKLDGSQRSIDTTSDYLLNVAISGILIGDRIHITNYIAEVWSRYLLRAPMTKKLDLVYLANDLISKSSTRIAQDPDTPFNNFHKALSPPVLKEVFTLLFKIICTPATKDQSKHLIQ